jgi:hypothetical protein
LKISRKKLVRVYNAYGLLKKIVVGNARIKYQLSITTQLHCGGHLGGRAQLPDTILEEDHPMTIPSNFGFN